MIPPDEQRMFSLSLKSHKTASGLLLHPLSSAAFHCLHSFDALPIGILCLDDFTQFPFLSADRIREIIAGSEDEVEEWGQLQATLLTVWKTTDGFRPIPEAKRRWDTPVFPLLAGDDGRKYVSDYDFLLWLKQD